MYRHNEYKFTDTIHPSLQGKILEKIKELEQEAERQLREFLEGHGMELQGCTIGKPKGKTYQVPFTYERGGYIHVKAGSPQEALEKADARLKAMDLHGLDEASGYMAGTLQTGSVTDIISF